jgi:hypothetical protein
MKYTVFGKIRHLENSWVQCGEVFSKYTDCYNDYCDFRQNIIAGYGGDIEEGVESLGLWTVVGFRNNDHIPQSFIAEIKDFHYNKWNDIIKLTQVTIINGG